MTAPRCLNPKIGSIEHVGKDGFIVESIDPSDPEFYGGKRLFKNYDDLIRFLAEMLVVTKDIGSSYGIRVASGNGKSHTAESEITVNCP